MSINNTSHSELLVGNVSVYIRSKLITLLLVKITLIVVTILPLMPHTIHWCRKLWGTPRSSCWATKHMDRHCCSVIHTIVWVHEPEGDVQHHFNPYTSIKITLWSGGWNEILGFFLLILLSFPVFFGLVWQSEIMILSYNIYSNWKFSSVLAVRTKHGVTLKLML